MTRAPLWTAAREGHDWRDEEVLAGVSWLTDRLDPRRWSERLERTRTTFEGARRRWAEGEQVPLFDPRDLVAWYAFQANAYAADRRNWYEPEAYRLATPFKRLGQLIGELDAIDGASERAERVMTDGRRQPDDGLYELLVAAAYKRRGWREVAFVPEQRGVAKTHDLAVRDGRRRWAAECKRVGRSGYAAEERADGERIAAGVHRASRDGKASAVVEVAFHVELRDVPDDYLAERLSLPISRTGHNDWEDELSAGTARSVDWPALRAVLAKDDLYFGSSRMIELAAGRYAATADHSVDGDWAPSLERPLHAHDVRRLSVVSWISASAEAARRKATHFRRIVAGAAAQLPGDRPGVVHVGYELLGGNGADARRDLLNRIEMMRFDPGASRLAWVYGNYMVPEHTTAPEESAALTETTATYPVGRPRTRDPLQSHLLFSDGLGARGPYWSPGRR